jgi:uncharacterized protein (DUF433 family)
MTIQKQVFLQSRYLNIPVSTVRWWSVGRDQYDGVIEPASTGRPVLLSFYNLVELHVLGVIRRDHNIKMPNVRSAIDYLRQRLKACSHPLIRHEMQTDGVHLFIERLGELINISLEGQRAMQEVMQEALKRIVWDESGLPRKLFPYTRSTITNAPSLVVIDPHLSGGRPVILGTGLATEIIAERYKAGESVEELAKDYGRDEDEIEEAIRCELQAAA